MKTKKAKKPKAPKPVFHPFKQLIETFYLYWVNKDEAADLRQLV